MAEIKEIVKPEEATGIKVIIEIHCDTEQEILAHLSIIRQNVKKTLKKIDEVTEPISLEDSNCYGWHEVEIELEK